MFKPVDITADSRDQDGCSDEAEIMAMRIDTAKRLLAETTLPVSSVAAQCGYSSIAHFRDAFRAATGSNPLACRKGKIRNAEQSVSRPS